MLKSIRLISTLVFFTGCVLNLTACGSASNEVVARIAGDTITKGTLDHWIPIEAIVSYQLFPKKPVPRGVVPDPPNYTACITRLEAVPAKLVQQGAKPTTAQLKGQCQQRYEMLKQQVLNFLITAQWEIGQGAEWGVKVSHREAVQRLEQVNKRYFPRKAEFTRYLAITGQTLSDQLFRSKVQLLEIRLANEVAARQKIGGRGPNAGRQQQELAKFLNESTKKWVARTSCRPGYVVPNCREYKGPIAPGVGA